MRLSKISLAGFKSFVDPTVLHLPSNLVGIVGPNGCGKSNIIDAVRWVMGESSARSLRGESMADVIFNGAAHRQPVGQASIELVFDNSAGRLGGPWASHAEIAIKRLVGRDSQSSYFLNGTRCRRRDIADIFLGTGLGPRSYAIIEQGMISRIIESRPEELRVFFEEAAGISKYKERRRETETRISHTRENLERFDDVRGELARQLQHLQRQARAAEQYRDYRAEERRLRAELLTLRWRGLQTDLFDCEQALRQQEIALEARLAEQYRLEVELETGRVRRLEFNEAFNATQGRYYQSGADISRLEQDLQHQRELRRRREDEQRQTTMALDQIEAQSAQDRAQRDELRAALTAAEPTLARLLTDEADANADLTAAEVIRREGQVDWEDFIRRNSEAQRQTEVERTRIDHLDRQLLQAERRLERLHVEQEQLAGTDPERELAQLRETEQSVAEDLQRDQEHLAQTEADLNDTREARRQTEQLLHATRERLQTGRGRLVSLQTLQAAALDRGESSRNEWLHAQGLTHTPRLAEQLTVNPDWETAVETVLAGWLDALCVTELETPARAAAQSFPGRLTLLETFSPEVTAAVSAGTLAAKVQTQWPLAGLLAGVQTAADLAEALARRADLPDGETLVTPDGVWCGRHWLRWGHSGDEGVLAREREIRERATALADDSAVLEQLAEQVEQHRVRHHELDQQRHDLQHAVNQGHRAHARAQGDVQTTQARWEQARTRRAALTEEQAELDAQAGQDREQAQRARLRLEDDMLTLESLHAEQIELGARRERLQDQLRQHRVRAEAARQIVARQTAVLEALRVRIAAVTQALERLEVQRRPLQVRQERLDADHVADADARWVAAEVELARALETRLTVEAELRDARQRLDDEDVRLEAGQQARRDCEQQAEVQRRQIVEQRLTLGQVRVRQENLIEPLHELDADPETLGPTLPDAAVESDWLARLEQVERRIQRLGPINLAAIEEFAELSERQRYLDAQNADLLEALATLEAAIRKIDRETRARFRETFERVNTGLQELFPRLFGGGQAYLELTCEDALDAGVAIMAKPPGKRIASISLLSGGEKALTAVALVFAIFQLNPAPFCLLDEVDAPLDEANIGRFGSLVQEMSATVQFIFITHNKATMEIAEHLAGVTMQEPGVSRLVAVDVEEAIRLVVA